MATTMTTDVVASTPAVAAAADTATHTGAAAVEQKKAEMYFHLI